MRPGEYLFKTWNELSDIQRQLFRLIVLFETVIGFFAFLTFWTHLMSETQLAFGAGIVQPFIFLVANQARKELVQHG